MPFRKSPAAIARALTEREYKDATPVQAAVLDADAEERDLLVSAQTGSGKTVAYGLAMADTLLQGADTLGPAADPLALIVAPTRELALQVQRELNWLYQYTGARVIACVGGMDPSRERRQLNDGAHIVVGTPGRLRDHLERRALRLGTLRVAVLDEADEMLDMGFREDLQFILDTTPPERRTLLFSATLPKAIVNMAQHYQKDALRIQTVGETRGHADIEYRAIRVAHNTAENVVVNLLRFMDPPSALVFCSTRNAVRHLEATLRERGFAAVALSGELSQSERNHALQALRDGRARVCVATDVAARGIDLPNLGLVIHADLPNDAEVLQHRSGRTGRAGKKGVSILLVPNSRRRRAEEMLGRARVTFTWSEPPSAEDIRKLDQDRLMQNPILTEPGTEEDLTMADALMAAHSPHSIAIAFAKIYRAQLPAPEDIAHTPDRPHSDSPHGKKKFPRERDPSQPRPPRNDQYQNDRPQNPSYQDRGPDRAPQQNRAPRKERGGMVGGVWFKITVGRERNADPKWLLPEICRQGDITKKEIGTIRVYETETRFEVDAAAAGKFAALVADRKKGGVRIFPAPDGMPSDTTPPPSTAPSPAAQDAPHDARPHYAKQHYNKPHHGKPGSDKGHSDKKGDKQGDKQGYKPRDKPGDTPNSDKPRFKPKFKPKFKTHKGPA